ncbi:MAG: CsbD family protein [Lewinellaceae bacterium]|nr:CsbD family protein [Lewinella sp.]MCB9279403.1 CsbD family protein [Lewinellaceae bacterium]
MSATKDRIKGNWKQIKGKLKTEYAQLTNDDLLYEEGKEDQLIGRLQERLGKTKDEIKAIIDGL